METTLAKEALEIVFNTKNLPFDEWRELLEKTRLERAKIHFFEAFSNGESRIYSLSPEEVHFMGNVSAEEDKLIAVTIDSNIEGLS